METADQLMQLIRLAYAAFDDAGVVAVSPAGLAEQVMRGIDPKDRSPMLVRMAAVLALRQMARQICTDCHREDERRVERGQGSLFELQGRYPAFRSVAGGPPERVYVLRSQLTYAERIRNVDRLAIEAAAKKRHSESLLAETDLLVREGTLSIDGEEPPQIEGNSDEPPQQQKP
jgi:hypothetical protein